MPGTSPNILLTVNMPTRPTTVLWGSEHSDLRLTEGGEWTQSQATGLQTHACNSPLPASCPEAGDPAELRTGHVSALAGR